MARQLLRDAVVLLFDEWRKASVAAGRQRGMGCDLMVGWEFSCDEGLGGVQGGGVRVGFYDWNML